jgi:transcriptional accessory protein Tex/SPT6
MSNLEFTSIEYHREINHLAHNLYSEALDQNDNDHDLAVEAIHDHLLHETVDSHQWVIYTYSNELVERFSDNAEAFKDIYDNESIGAIVADQGLDALKPIIAYFAMYQDISDRLTELGIN